MQLEIQHVEYIYQEGSISAHQALHDVCLTIKSGELIALIGHGGSGKSTLSLLLAGLYKPSSGRIDTYDVMNPQDSAFRSIGLVFQYPEQQMFAETVFDEVAFGAKNFGVPQDYLPLRVRKSLEQVGLDPETFSQRSPFSLSGGQKRRVCLAAVLAVEPKMIILDEPTAGLDEEGRRWMMQLARELHAEGRTVLWVTHNMQEAAELAERIIVLNQGRVLLDGTPQEVFAHEELLLQSGLAIPQAAAIVRELRQRGLDIPGQAISVAEAAEEIAHYLEHKDDPLPDLTEDTEEPEEDTELDLESILAGLDPEQPPEMPKAKWPGDYEPRFTPWQGGHADV